MIPERVTTSAVGVIHPPLRLSVCKMFPQLHLRCHAQIHASSIENDQSWFATVGKAYLVTQVTSVFSRNSSSAQIETRFTSISFWKDEHG
jgi:hypothetical protein